MATDNDIIGPAIARLIVREGGYVDHPADIGGPTKFGITARTLGEFRKLGRAATAAEVQALEKPEATEIYRQMYIPPLALDLLADPGLIEVLIDSAALFGPDDPVRWMQVLLEVKADGVMGPVTRAAMRAAPPMMQRVMALDLIGLRRDQHEQNVAAGKVDGTFLKGWLNRCDQLETEVRRLQTLTAPATANTGQDVGSAVTARPDQAVPAKPGGSLMDKTGSRITAAGSGAVVVWIWNELIARPYGVAVMPAEVAAPLAVMIVPVLERLLYGRES